MGCKDEMDKRSTELPDIRINWNASVNESWWSGQYRKRKDSWKRCCDRSHGSQISWWKYGRSAREDHTRRTCNTDEIPIIIFTCSGELVNAGRIVSRCRWQKHPQHWNAMMKQIIIYHSINRSYNWGVTASFAMLGDVILAEPGALTDLRTESYWTIGHTRRISESRIC